MHLMFGPQEQYQTNHERRSKVSSPFDLLRFLQELNDGAIEHAWRNQLARVEKVKRQVLKQIPMEKTRAQN